MATLSTRLRQPLRRAAARLAARPKPPAADAATKALSSRSELAGLFAAAVSVPLSYQQSLMPRSPIDQGIVSGLALSLSYALTSVTAEAIDAAAEHNPWGVETEDSMSGTAIAVDVGALAGSFVAQQLLRRRDDERLSRAAARTLSRQIGVAALSGLAATAARGVSIGINRATTRWVPPAVVAAVSGLAAATVADLLHRAPAHDRTDRLVRTSDWAGAVGSGIAVTAGVTGLAAAERAAAFGLRRTLEHAGGRVGRGVQLPWGLISHAASLFGVGVLIERLMHAANLRAELAAGEPPADAPTPPTSPYVSSGPGSLISWRSLTAQARRHVTGTVTRDEIAYVMQTPASADPVRVYAGVDNAITSNERVELALAEIDRTGALDRSLLVLICPTGTGQINPALTEAVEYLTLGDCATVALQYSKRPSVLSMDRLAEAREQNRALWVALQQRLFARPPSRRPKVVLFGESLGAHASQDVFLHWGTHGPKVMGIDHALWVGTPYASKWKQQVFGPPRPDVNPALVGQFGTVAEFAALDDDLQHRIRYVLLTHEDDAVAYFGLELLLRSPDWLEDPRPAVVPPSMRWTPVITFLQVLADMKNATNIIPGKFEARGHDYRKGLAQAVKLVYELDATPEQLARIEHAMRQSEANRADAGVATMADAPTVQAGVP